MIVYTTAQAKELAAQVDRALPPPIRFYRYGDRTTQIIRFLIENDMDVAKTVTAIKQTALFRLYWHADEIAMSDVKDAFAQMECFTTGVTEDGRIVWFLNCNFQTPVKVQDFMLASIYAVDDLQRRLFEECQRRGIQEAYKDYCIMVADTANVSYAAITTKMEKAGMEVFVRHFPSFMSVNDIYVSDDPAFRPVYSWEHATFYNLNTPFYLRALWKVCCLFMPSRWSSIVQLLGDQTLPASFAKSFMPKAYGGTNEGSFQKWMEENAALEGVSLDTPPRALVDQRVLDQFGENSGMVASAIPGTALRGWLWKRTNAGHRWHHYYFVLLQDGLLYYFKNVDDTDAQNGFLLENCRIVVRDDNDDLRREGIRSITLASSILKYQNPPLLEPGQAEEERGAERSGEEHKYWFVLRTPSRDYLLACNSTEQRSQWMFALNRIIRESTERATGMLSK